MRCGNLILLSLFPAVLGWLDQKNCQPTALENCDSMIEGLFLTRLPIMPSVHCLKFHIVKNLNEAVDTVRREETRREPLKIDSLRPLHNLCAPCG